MLGRDPKDCLVGQQGVVRSNRWPFQMSPKCPKKVHLETFETASGCSAPPHAAQQGSLWDLVLAYLFIAAKISHVDTFFSPQ